MADGGRRRGSRRVWATLCTVLVLMGAGGPALAQTGPWSDPKLSPDERAKRLEQAMTLDEKIRLVHGPMAVAFRGAPMPEGAIGSAGYIPGNSRLGIPALQETDAGVGVANPLNVRPGDGATPLPSGLALAASWSPETVYAGAAMIGRQAWRKGFNVMLAGGANLARDPRNGRNFEYLGEDPLLAGVLAGEVVRGIQDQHVVSTIKHFAINDQETGRQVLDARIGDAAARESDLLAFQIAIERGKPGSVMCAYNKVNGAYACENEQLLTRTLKSDWGFPGWVMSDWGAVHGLDAALRGLDQQSGEQIDKEVFFGEPLKAAALRDPAYAARVSDMVRRILRSMFAVGLFEHPPLKTPIDYAADAEVARRAAVEGMVLLHNPRGLLPLAKTARHIVVIGAHADAGVLSGGGSSQVASSEPGGRAIPLGGTDGPPQFREMLFHPSSPLKAVAAKAKDAQVSFDDGRYPARAAAAASRADLAIIFATQWMTEGEDAPDLSLPNGQDALIAAVVVANPNTIVVLETGGPVLMPWLDKTGAVLAAWYPGARGGEAIADVLFGDAEPAGRLPLTFPARNGQNPRPEIPGLTAPAGTSFPVDYVEGADVGYRWFARAGETPLFPFGYGLSYTRFAYSDVKVTGGETLTISVTVANTGTRAGADVPQVYLTSAAGRPLRRLIGWSKLMLKAGEQRTVTVTADPRLIADFDETAQVWRVAGGDYSIAVGASAIDLKLSGGAKVKARTLKP